MQWCYGFFLVENLTDLLSSMSEIWRLNEATLQHQLFIWIMYFFDLLQLDLIIYIDMLMDKTWKLFLTPIVGDGGKVGGW